MFVGKTTLVHRLIHGQFEGSFHMTDGIQMNTWVTTDISFSLWDFSGQNIYHNTHSLFFSTRVIFMLVWNPRQLENESMLEQYFQLIRNCSKKAPIILVSTHAKDTSRMTENAFNTLNRKYGRGSEQSMVSASVWGNSVQKGEKNSTKNDNNDKNVSKNAQNSNNSNSNSTVSSTFPTSSSKISRNGPICCYHHIDSLSGVGLLELRNDIIEYSLKQPFVEQRVPYSYLKLEHGIQELAQNGRFAITTYEFITYATELYHISPEGAKLVLVLFHDWGIVHILSENDIILDPQQLSNIMTCVVSYKADMLYKMGDGKLGLLRHNEIGTIWKQYDEALRPLLLQLIHQYKLAYPLFDR